LTIKSFAANITKQKFSEHHTSELFLIKRRERLKHDTDDDRYKQFSMFRSQMETANLLQGKTQDGRSFTQERGSLPEVKTSGLSLVSRLASTEKAATPVLTKAEAPKTLAWKPQKPKRTPQFRIVYPVNEETRELSILINHQAQFLKATGGQCEHQQHSKLTSLVKRAVLEVRKFYT